MNDESTKKPCLIRARDRGPEASMSHPFNPNSLIHGHLLGMATGLERIGVNLIRVPPGKESFIYHRHHGEEEFLYILSGRGIAEIGDETFEVGPGDFMGFPVPSVAHHLKNPFEEDLVYLSCGEKKPTEIAEFPRLGKTMIRSGSQVSIFETSAAEAFPGLEKVK
ncbi:cupin domain-containing protein [Polyangium sp. y55x31]|uniref:cupin domain-containing protein n=1 Tax=Polyangium sp. y55x31 TaxID=3042688 RepID=UPI0024822EC3|nr:cupin domain-containing protein [Polyangium sp. y55x31]MDI1482097.1 cupin domain-containing protein [Polyangium sp. y55x31]